LIHKNDRFVGTGHNSEIVKDDAGNNWIFYHAVDKTNPRVRVLMLDEVQWQNVWPYVDGNSPSSVKNVPVFNE
jgi:arabinan endo-1,5-alpha-L-arabinosidase